MECCLPSTRLLCIQRGMAKQSALHDEILQLSNCLVILQNIWGLAVKRRETKKQLDMIETSKYGKNIKMQEH